jgi:predicted nucleic acid-binding protein
VSLVVDASAAVDLVIGRPELTALLLGQDLHVPATFDVEAVAALRSLELRRQLPSAHVDRARGDLRRLAVIRYLTPSLLERAWQLRAVITIQDGIYVALAEGLGCPLLTTDLRLARAARAVVDVLAPGLAD